MPHLVHRYQDADVGDVVTLRSGSPPMTLVRFVPVDAPPIEPGIQNAGYQDSKMLLNAQVMWVTEAGVLGQATIPVDALDFKDDEGKNEAGTKRRTSPAEPLSV